MSTREPAIRMDQNREQQEIGRRLTDAYAAFRRKISHNYVMGKRKLFSSVWDEVARLVIKIEADPFEYIRAQFDECEGDFPFIDTLATARAVENYQKLESACRAGIGVSTFRRQVETLSGYARSGMNTDRILMDETKEFAACIRICMVSREKFDLVFARFSGQARREAEFDRPLRAYLLENYHDRALCFIREAIPNTPSGEPIQSSGIPGPLVDRDLVPTGPRLPIT